MINDRAVAHPNPGSHGRDARATGTLAGIVLAAGLSSRMRGAFKPLLELNGKPVIRRVVESLLSELRVDPVLVVTGYRSENVCEALADSGVKFVYNAVHEHGEMLSSIHTGIRALAQDVAGFVLALGDQPGISQETIRLLVEAWERAPNSIIIPEHQCNRGHPIIIPARCIPEIMALGRDQTLKSVTHRPGQQIVRIPVDDPAIRMDIDTPEDYQEALRRWSQRPAARNATEALHGPSPR
jgi:molybdenum cofactor cytidylyltransferase